MNELSDVRAELVEADKEVASLENYAEAVKLASVRNKELVDKQVEVIEKKVVQIQKVYVPQIEYVKEYVKDENETSCDGSNRLISNIVY